MAFKYVGTLAPHGGRVLVGGDKVPTKTIVANSEVIQIGDVVEWDADGFILPNNSAGGALVGVVTAVMAGDKAVDPDSGTLDTFTMAADNETVAKKYAVIDISGDSLYSADADATLGTTTGSDLPGYYLDLATNSETTLDESSASATTGTAFSWGVDPDDSGNVICNLVELAHRNNGGV